VENKWMISRGLVEDKWRFSGGLVEAKIIGNPFV
jgi:hypothetical protein